MTIYFIIVALILLLGLFQKSNRISKDKYCLAIGLLFALVTGLRSPLVGADTTVYYMEYEKLFSINTLKEVIENKSDIAYFIFSWIYAKLDLPFWFLTLTVALFFYYALTKLIRTYSPDPTLSFLILMAFCFFQFSMTGIRQTIAIGFVLLSLYEAFKSHYKLKMILIYIIIGCFFHLSCIITLLFIPLLLLKRLDNNNLLVISLFIIVICFFFRNQLMLTFLYLSEDTKYSQYIIENSGAGLSTYVVYLVIYLILIIKYANFIQISKRGLFDISLVFISLIFQSTVLVQPVMFRIVWYFSISLIVIIPLMIQMYEGQDKKIINFIMYTGILYMYLGITISSANVVPYKFFWE